MANAAQATRGQTQASTLSETRSWGVHKPAAQLLLAAGIAFACSEGPGSRRLALRTDAVSSHTERVLGFESPGEDWNSQIALHATADAFQGDTAVEFSPQGWTELVSAPLAGDGCVGAAVSLMLRLPEAVPWGDIRVVLKAPSRHLWWEELPAVPLTGVPVGEFVEVRLPTSAAARVALSSPYDDLQVRVIVNGPSLSAPYALDSIVLCSSQQGDASPPQFSESVEVSVDLPYIPSLPPAAVVVTVLDELRLDDRTVIGSPGGSAIVANLGGVRSQLGADSALFGDLLSNASVAELYAGATVHGSLVSRGGVSMQSRAEVRGSTAVDSETLYDTARLTVQWPPPGGALHLSPDEARSAAPDSYSTVDVRSRASLVLAPGEYFVDSLATEPESTLQFVDATLPTVLFVRKGISLKGELGVPTPGESPLIVVYTGTAPAYIEGGFAGVLIAPNAAVELRRPRSGVHTGTFQAKSLSLFSDAKIVSGSTKWIRFLCEYDSSKSSPYCACAPNDVACRFSRSGVLPAVPSVPAGVPSVGTLGDLAAAFRNSHASDERAFGAAARALPATVESTVALLSMLDDSLAGHRSAYVEADATLLAYYGARDARQAIYERFDSSESACMTAQLVEDPLTLSQVRDPSLPACLSHSALFHAMAVCGTQAAHERLVRVVQSPQIALVTRFAALREIRLGFAASIAEAAIPESDPAVWALLQGAL